MTPATYTPLRWILLLIAVILFLLGAFSVGLPLNPIDLGLAFFAAAFLVPWTAVA
jgi:hypothetical protein